MILLLVENISVAEKLKDLFGGIFLSLAIFLWFYGSFHATLYDDEKKKYNKKHESFRSISSRRFRFRLGLPIPILSKADNDIVKRYKLEYNKINISFWTSVVISIILYNI